MRKTKTMEGYCWLCKSSIITCCKGRMVIALAAMFLVKSSRFTALRLQGLVNCCAEKDEVRNIFLNLVGQVSNPHVMVCHRATTWWYDIGSGICNATATAKSIMSAMSTTSSESTTLSTRSNMSTTRQVNEVHDVDFLPLVHLWAISWAMSTAHVRIFIYNLFWIVNVLDFTAAQPIAVIGAQYVCGAAHCNCVVARCTMLYAAWPVAVAPCSVARCTCRWSASTRLEEGPRLGRHPPSDLNCAALYNCVLNNAIEMWCGQDSRALPSWDQWPDWDADLINCSQLIAGALLPWKWR